MWQRLLQSSTIPVSVQERVSLLAGPNGAQLASRREPVRRVSRVKRLGYSSLESDRVE